MAMQRPVTPSASYQAVPQVDDPAYLSRGYGTGTNDFASSPPATHYDRSRLGRFEEDFDAPTRGTSVIDGDMHPRSSSRSSTLNQGLTPSRGGTLKKKGSVKRSGSLKRSGSRKSLHAGSIRGVAIDDQERGYDRENSVFYTPVPTKGSPTEILAERFQTWRKFLKDLITYFREVAASYEHRAKSLLKVSNVINNTNAPSVLLTEGGLNDANRILRDFHKQAIAEANKARDVETDVINQLSSLRADLAQKIKEIKSLSGDFKNNVEKEKEITRKCVTALEEALATAEADPTAAAGKGDPYVVRLGVERQVERQIDEENYLHRAYLNIENSGRELESIVVGEIQKAYNALASILKREADEQYNTVERLRNGPIAMPRDLEWSKFVRSDPHFVDPDLPLRKLGDIQYPGKYHPATTEVRAGMLERKSKYLKSYTPGWYVLSPTHLHEFKSADRIYTQPPVMSLYLPDQKLGSRSQPGSSSHKFVIKGRQAGSMHRGHTWVFRAETYDTMVAWFEDIKALTEKSGEERNAFVRRHASVRSTSAGSARSASSDGGLEEDEADAVPFSANQSLKDQARDQSSTRPTRPSPGGRFPSDLMVNRNLQAPLSPSSGSSEVNYDLTTASGGPPQEMHPMYLGHESAHQPLEPMQHAQYAQPDQQQPHHTYENPYTAQQSYAPAAHDYPVQPIQSESHYPIYPENDQPLQRHDSNNYGNWIAPAAGGAATVALANEAYRKKQLAQQHAEARQQELNGQSQTMNYSQDHSAHVHEQYSGEIRPDQIDDTGYVAPNVQPTSAPIVAPIMDNQTHPQQTNGAETPVTTSSFLGESEVGAAPTSGKTVNGGPVPVELVDTAEEMVQPGMVKRTGTDFSVSDLHVPGQYPRTSISDATITPRVPNGIATTQ
ncbi:hypothetical protein COCVIDRAFT_38760 [Bipolaris victoriae FI3]|uniref:PH domain-containing protein n=1 Tax=Bipolaris victoriae (strain FI3) TaxID=930091 RepID=W7ENQ2_BIPV3|nr:hypothetical protein COCVIDRAFT_38760 [Bipolaris victoriae FI3]